MERKKKSKLCIANIDMASVIKLAQFSADLENEVREFCLLCQEILEKGEIRKTICFSNTFLDWTADALIKALKAGRITPKNLQK
jgi:hypothetical protein